MSSSSPSSSSPPPPLPGGGPPPSLTSPSSPSSSPSSSPYTSSSSVLPPPRLQPPTPSAYDLGQRPSGSSTSEKEEEEEENEIPYHASPLAAIAHRTQKQRRAAAKLHQKVSKNILKNKEIKKINISIVDNSNSNSSNNTTTRTTPQALPENNYNNESNTSQLTTSNLANRNAAAAATTKGSATRLSKSRQSLESVGGGPNGRRGKQGFLSELLSGESTKNRNQSIDNGPIKPKTLCTKITEHACLFVSKSSAAWHDEIYGKKAFFLFFF